MTHYMIGKLLKGRYQIVQMLGAGVFGQTYIAIDVENPENPKCVVKQLKVTGSQPSHLQTLRLHFLSETETLKHLGCHEQIPQLIACFEENERFYLVQEFIEGHSLTAELPVNEHLGYLWSENEVILFLQDVLGILKFVHSQGVIHCDVKPENLIRRACDGKLVLIDFGSIQPVDFGIDTVLPIYKIPVTSLGYIPPEQFIGQTHPNSDIYALGIIAIQALTGITPLRLQTDPCTNEILWRSNYTQVSDYLAAVISQMVRYNYKDRFKSVDEILRALQQMRLESRQPQIVEVEHTTLSASASDSQIQDSSIEDNNVSDRETAPSSLLTGMKVGLAANSLVMGFGVYCLIYNSPAYSETETLYKATEEYQTGDLQEAIALAKSIPSTSNVYPEAQASIEEWEKQWQIAARKYQAAEQAFNEGRWSDVLRASSQLPNILHWQSQINKLVEQAKVNIEAQTNDLLAKAYENASAKNFSAALNYLRQIPQETSAGAIVQEKLAEYSHKQRIRATHFLQKAYDQAAIGNFDSALKLLHKVPKDTPLYPTVQAKLIEYSTKQRLRVQSQKIASSKTTPSVNMTEPFITTNTRTSLKSFTVGNELYEINIR
jgi:tetratricopeptide (TPR) repeat protein